MVRVVRVNPCMDFFASSQSCFVVTVQMPPGLGEELSRATFRNAVRIIWSVMDRMFGEIFFVRARYLIVSYRIAMICRLEVWMTLS